MNWATILTALTLCVNSFTQTNENFTDGNFSHNPQWLGDTLAFKINENQQLQLNDTVAGSAWLGTRAVFDASAPIEWRGYLELDFSPSNSNRVEVWLIADSLRENGIFLRIGESGSNDAVRLFQAIHGSEQELFSGAFGTVASAFQANLLIRRTQSGMWTAWIALEQDLMFVGSAMEQAIPTGSWLGVQCFYTNSNVDGFVFDDFYFGPWETDTVAPEVDVVHILNGKTLTLRFNEALPTQQINPSFLQIMPTVPIDSAVQSDDKNLTVFLAESLLSTQEYQMNLTGFRDTAGNEINQNISGIVYYHIETAEYADIVISEIMSDPEPGIGLPKVEYVELYNRSSKIVSLENWRFFDGSTIGVFPEEMMLPYSRKVLCKSGCIDSFPNAVELDSWPSLNNGGELLTLVNGDSLLIDSITYSDDWYDPIQNDGRSLERINLDLLCSSSKNWSPSIAETGGTPGLSNSINDNQHLISLTDLISFEFLSQSELQIEFSQPLDSSKLTEVAVSNSLQNELSQIEMPRRYASEMKLTFEDDFPKSVPFEMRITNINNCNEVEGSEIMRQLVFAEPVDTNDLIINEILFDPYAGGVDFVEVMNRTEKYLNLRGVQIQRRNDEGEVIDADSVDKNFILAPKELLVFTEDAFSVAQDYPSSDTNRMFELDLPNFPNDSGLVVLSVDGQAVDGFKYDVDIHFQLLESFDGKSLERINSELPTHQRGNWHTASESVGFATPGRQNSQASTRVSHGKVQLASKVISPDNDGYEDILQLEYNLDATGYLVSATIYSKWGVPIRHLTSNEMVSPDGAIYWDGLSDESHKASIGEYVLIFEAIHSTNGSTFAQKLPVIVAGKL